MAGGLFGNWLHQVDRVASKERPRAGPCRTKASFSQGRDRLPTAVEGLAAIRNDQAARADLRF